MPPAMSDVLVKIKRAVLSGRFEFSRKAADEMDADDLTRLNLDVAESIVNAVAIYKTIVHVALIEATGARHFTSSRAPICGVCRSTRKGSRLPKRASRPNYFLVSSKRAE